LILFSAIRSIKDKFIAMPITRKIHED